jgi:Mg-chelatase subunit ChlD
MVHIKASTLMLAPLILASSQLVNALVVNSSAGLNGTNDTGAEAVEANGTARLNGTTDTKPEAVEVNGTADAHIYFLLDRSGSMHSIASDVVGGFNSFLQEQRSMVDGARLRMTLVQFDSQEPHEVLFKGREISDVPDLTSKTFIPRSQTPLFDALGHVLAMAEGCKSSASPGTREAEEKIVVVTFTDGEENASREFSRKSIFDRIDKLQHSGWAFVFLGANQDSYASGSKMGFGAANTQNFAFDRHGVAAAFGSISSSMFSMREKLHHVDELKMYNSNDFFEGRKAAEADYRARSRATDL